jgi:carbonic anhydrase/acetyltransferase-like protein (isoleucine patch superfamily)
MIFLGSNSALGIWVDVCKRANIPITGVIDSDYYGNTDSICGVPVIDTEDNIENYYNKKIRMWTNSFFIATNWDPSNLLPERDNEKREKFKEILNRYPDIRLQNIIDPLAVVPKDVELGGGNYIGAGAVLEPEVKIGRHTQVWYQTIIGHGVEIGEDCTLQRRSGIWGGNMGNHVYLSIGAIYGGNYKDSYIGDNAWIHPGLAVAGRPIKEGETVTIREQLRQRRTQTVGSYDTEALDK